MQYDFSQCSWKFDSYRFVLAFYTFLHILACIHIVLKRLGYYVMNDLFSWKPKLKNLNRQLKNLMFLCRTCFLFIFTCPEMSIWFLGRNCSYTECSYLGVLLVTRQNPPNGKSPSPFAFVSVSVLLLFLLVNHFNV